MTSLWCVRAEENRQCQTRPHRESGSMTSTEREINDLLKLCARDERVVSRSKKGKHTTQPQQNPFDGNRIAFRPGDLCGFFRPRHDIGEYAVMCLFVYSLASSV